MSNRAKIKRVIANSVADMSNIKKGDYVIAFDGYAYSDELDYIYYNSRDKFSITIEDSAGNQSVVDIVKNEDEPIGIILEDTELDIMPCANKCVFCFVDQCAKGMRDTLYVKDDDYRLSFISGNYITLSNIGDTEIERIIRLKLSPLYISVHCADAELRKKICANPNTKSLFDKIDRLIKGGIRLHAQIVLMENINDGDELLSTITELYNRYPSIQSLAVVPVGLTKHREGLYPLKPISQECAKTTILEVEQFNQRAIDTNGEGFVWCSDEMYLKAGIGIPNYDYYGAFSQIENGVGLVREFLFELEDELCYTPDLVGNYTLITGKSFEPILKNIAVALNDVYGINLNVVAIVNEFFGESVTVAGLVTGGDIIKQLKGKLKYKDIIIPHTMLREFETVFLDDVKIEDIEQELDCKAHIARGGEGLIKILKGD